jgi:hypothetical protein
MSKSKHTLFEAVLARMSLGAVPMDGVYWFDPKAMREHAQKGVEKPKAGQDGSAEETCHERHSN